MKKLKNMKQSTLLLLLAAGLMVAAVVTGYMHHRAGAMGTAGFLRAELPRCYGGIYGF